MNSDYDLAIVGGGISGIGVAYQASKKGLKLVLFDKSKLGSKTSDNSLRIIHGGFRYLQSLNIFRTIESIKAQRDLINDFPDLIKPLNCFMPLNRFGLKSYFPAMLGAFLYSCLLYIFKADITKPKVISAIQFDQSYPALKGKAKYGALQWTDALLEDNHKLVQKHIDEVISQNGEIKEDSVVSKIIREKDNFKILYNQGLEVTAKYVVNTAGAWINKFEFSGIEPSFKNVLWTKAVNFVVPKNELLNSGFGVTSKEGRLYFVVPREDSLSIGTFYYPFTSEPDSLNLSEEELDIALSSFNETIPELKVLKNQIIKTEIGVLPALSYSQNNIMLYGSEKIINNNNYIEVLSTKYTTFREQGKKVLKLISR